MPRNLYIFAYFCIFKILRRSKDQRSNFDEASRRTGEIHVTGSQNFRPSDVRWHSEVKGKKWWEREARSRGKSVASSMSSVETLAKVALRSGMKSGGFAGLLVFATNIRDTPLLLFSGIIPPLVPPLVS